MEICPEEFSNNVPAHLMLHGHLKPVLKQVCPAKNRFESGKTRKSFPFVSVGGRVWAVGHG